MGIEERLRETMARRTARMETDEWAAWGMIQARLAPARRRRSLTVALAAAVAAGLTAVALLGLWLPLRHQTSAPGPASPAPALSPRITDVVDVGPWPGVIAAGEGSVWVGVLKDSGEPELVRIDESTNRVVDRLPIEVNDVVVAFGSVWASTVPPSGGTTVVRIDPSTDEVIASFEGVGGLWSLAAGEGAVWVLTAAEGESVLTRIDPGTNEATHWVTVVGEPRGLAAGDGAVWLLLTGTREGTELVRVDPQTSSPLDRIVGLFDTVAVGDGSVWVSTTAEGGSGEDIRRINPTTGAFLEPSIVLSTAFRSFGVGEGGVWFIGGPAEPQGVCRLNTETIKVDSCVEVSGYADTGLNWPAALDAQTDTIWVANYQDSVTRIDLR